MSKESWLWVKDEVEGFVEAKLLSPGPGEGATVEIEGTPHVKKKSELGWPILSRTELTQDFPDMVRMGDVNEATILRAIKLRFLQEKIYTCIGTILVAMNPFKRIDIYGPDFVTLHRDAAAGEPPPPHVYQVAAAAYKGVRSERQDQSIIISGESGAGKTEATKHCLKFFAEAAGSAVGNMQDKLVQANPLLEAFGNAKTVRNNNSSRFGKFMEVHFNGRASICGCRIQNYLLEKTRIVTQTSTERNYHIFYQLPTAAPDALLNELMLSRNPADYGYTKHSQLRVEGLDDAEEFRDVMKSLETLEFSEEVYKPLFQIVGGLLHLSNVEFDGTGDDAKLKSIPACSTGLVNAAKLLGFDAAALGAGLTEKLIVARSERLRSPLSPFMARVARDSLSMALYNRMFDWLVQQLNKSMAAGLGDSSKFCGVLDIAGFEIFQNNSFEQLCINFCNEKLQQHFNNYVFKLELAAYNAEGITYDDIVFADNQDRLDLVEKKPLGLLVMLDDECRVPKGSDKGFLDKIMAAHKGNKLFVAPGGKAKPSEFGIDHYAGLVLYNSETFMEKNKDELLLNIQELCEGSTVGFIRTLFEGGGAAGSPAPTGGGANKLTLGAGFRIQLDSLMATINSTAPQYIRCIKSNQAKKPLVLEGEVCLQQLRFAGVFEAVRVRQLGYPFRFLHEKWFMRYRCTVGGAFLNHIGKDKSSVDWREKCRALCAGIAAAFPGEPQFQPPEVKFKLGKTSVLYRALQHLPLENIRENVQQQSAVRIQKVWRGVGSRKLARRLRILRDKLREGLKLRSIPKVREVLALGNKGERRIGVEMKKLLKLEAELVEEERRRLEEEKRRREEAKARGEQVKEKEKEEEREGEEGKEENVDNRGISPALSFWETLKQSTKGPVILPSGWDTKWDISVGRLLFYNEKTGERAYDVAGVAQICGLPQHAMYLPAGLPPLPNGWKAFVSRTSGLPYYVGTTTAAALAPLSPRLSGAQPSPPITVTTNPLEVPAWIIQPTAAAPPVMTGVGGKGVRGGAGALPRAAVPVPSPLPSPSPYADPPLVFDSRLPPGWTMAVSKRTGVSYFRGPSGEAVLNIADIPRP